jgi:alkylresorcinol/alkylpyrone synthase
MEQVRIISAASAHPPLRVPQDVAAAHIGALSGDPRRVRAIARGTRIQSRAAVLAPEQLAALGSIAERNAIYQRFVPGLAREAVLRALGESPRDRVGCVVTSSCTGYTVPGWGVELVESLGLPFDTARLPITEAGCAGGVVALARAADYLRTRPGACGVAAAAELCSLAFHAGGGEGNITSTHIFGDGAGAALLRSGDGPGVMVLDSMSVLIPNSRDALGFNLTDTGFYPVLSRDLATLLAPATGEAVAVLLGRNGVAVGDVAAWLLHPGGARILSGLERTLGVDRARMHWSWDAMREFGNTSSAAIFDVLARYFADPVDGYAVCAAFGPGVSIELLLLRRPC